MPEKVVVLGASNKPERYAYKALVELTKHGHIVIPVNPALKEINGIKVINKLSDIKEKVDTVTLYVGPERLEAMIPEIIALKPKRIISNPGTESASMRSAAKNAGINYEEACTLVMLSTGQY